MNGLKYIISFLCGAAIGGAATYIYVNKKANEKIDKECKEYKEYLKRNSANVSEPLIVKSNLTTEDIKEFAETASNAGVKQKDEKKPKTDYTKYFNKQADEKKEEPKGYQEEEKPKSTNVLDRLHYISEDEFADNENGYLKCEYNYYIDDGHITTLDGDLPVDSDVADELIDELYLDAIFEKRDEVYVRMDYDSTDYHIICCR